MLQLVAVSTFDLSPFRSRKSGSFADVVGIAVERLVIVDTRKMQTQQSHRQIAEQQKIQKSSILSAFKCIHMQKKSSEICYIRCYISQKVCNSLVPL